ncbi:MAG: hypothetical protein ACR2H2_18550 [Solirubrobacteraceae bacterium]
MSRRKKQEDAPESLPEGICVAGHPRSAGLVRRAKGWGGLIGVVLCTALALGAHLPAFETMLRGLAGGVVGYLVLWALALAVARQLVVAEVRARHAELQRAAADAASDG